MKRNSARILRLEPHSALLEIVVRWRHEAFLRDMGFTYEQSLRQLEDLLRKRDEEAAFLAELEGRPAGTCLYVRREIDPPHDLTPWLAGLYVDPAFRRRAVGRALVAAVEAHGRSLGCPRLHLYTTLAEDYYAPLGWQVQERFSWKGEPFVLMHRDL